MSNCARNVSTDPLPSNLSGFIHFKELVRPLRSRDAGRSDSFSGILSPPLPSPPVDRRRNCCSLRRPLITGFLPTFCWLVNIADVSSVARELLDLDLERDGDCGASKYSSSLRPETDGGRHRTRAGRSLCRTSRDGVLIVLLWSGCCVL